MTLYTVYDNITDMPVCIDSTSHHAAEQMGILHESFLCAVARRKDNQRWYIEARNVSYAEWREQREFERER